MVNTLLIDHLGKENFKTNSKSQKLNHYIKNEKKSLFSNYTPVSLLPQIGKILEKCFELNLSQFFSCSNFYSDCQYGFRPKLSTTHAVADFTEIVSRPINSSMGVHRIFSRGGQNFLKSLIWVHFINQNRNIFSLYEHLMTF